MAMRFAATAAFAFAFASVSVGAQEGPDVDESAKQEKKICRTEKATGSLTRRTRICLTEAQWREFHNRTRRGLDELQGSASGAPKCISLHDAACGTAAGPGG